MKIIFYSDQCEFCKKLILYLEKNNLINQFKLINIDNLDKIPKDIDIVPAIVDPDLLEPLKGKLAFEYVNNLKFFNNSTNNYKNPLPPKPDIPEDSKAINNSYNNLEL